MTNNSKNWTIQKSLNTYQIEKWSDGFFGVNKNGNICVYPNKDQQTPSICMKKVINEIKEEGVDFPVVIRFHDILRSQVKNLNEVFQQTIQEANYQGEYFGVYPTKVNQLREVVEEIVEAGSSYNYGLEAGSKAELLSALAYNTNMKSLTVLNGYKDDDYMKLAMLGRTMGKKVVIVIEKLSEIDAVLKISKDFEVEPIIGVRARLTSKAAGKWADSSGEQAKFGLSVSEIVDLIELLRTKKKLHWLKLFHFHVGSQIPDIRTIKDCLTEGARIYTNLIEMGVPLEYFDVGGGVGVNYDGSKSNCPSSTNYTLGDYIADVVYILKDICDVTKTPHPHIVTETGRAIAAHHSCVITKVFGEINLTKHKNIETELKKSDHMLIKNIKERYSELDITNFQDIYNDASLIKDEVNAAFKLGILNLKERSVAETLYWSICHKILIMTENQADVPAEIKALKTTLSDKYLCNFSIFQSAPDSWAIGQLLPVIPITRLNERPSRECTIADITCDSDGKINSFIGQGETLSTLPIHELKADEDYFVGLFLTGAYQDIMGDMHNLFGRLNEVHVYSDESDSQDFYIEEIVQGHSAAQVLNIMQYNPAEMSRKVKAEIDHKIKTGELKPRNGVKLIDFYERCLESYTYLK